MISLFNKAVSPLLFWSGRLYCTRTNRWWYESQQFRALNERPIEYAFVFKAIRELSPRSVLDVGTGDTALPSLIRSCGPIVTATDNVVDYWPKGMFNRHYHVIDDDITSSRLSERFDLVVCVSVLEHIRKHDAAVRCMFSLLNEGGHLALTFPYNEREYVPDVYRLEGAGYGRDFPFIGQVFSREEIVQWLEANRARIVQQEYWQVFTGALWTFGKRVVTPLRVGSDEKHQLSCVLMQKE